MSLWISFVIIAGVVGLDLISKALIDAYMTYGQTVSVIPGLFNFHYVHNTGAAFSLFGDWEGARVFFIVLTGIALVGFFFVLIRYGKQSKLMSVAFALIIAGAFGNWVDRIFLGYVRDFIEFAFFEFPVFNVADISLCFGVGVFAVYFIFFFKEPEKKTAADELGAPTRAGVAEEEAERALEAAAERELREEEQREAEDAVSPAGSPKGSGSGSPDGGQRDLGKEEGASGAPKS